jgi:hypothetical protein
VTEPSLTGALRACAAGLLSLAASLGDGIPVDLQDALTRLDNANTDLITTAIRHAAGRRPATSRQTLGPRRSPR